MNSRFKARRAPTPLNPATLQELALRYAGKYATTRAKLAAYLASKIRERGWDGEENFDLEALASRFAELGYVDDASYALGKSRALSARGYGKRRLADQLRVAGVGEEDSMAANAHAESEAVNAALRFAERRRFGPFSATAVERPQREKNIAAMVRAGHGFALSRAIAALTPESVIDLDKLRDLTRFIDV